MKGTALLWLPDVLRAAGLTVVEQRGWETRARTSGGFQSGPFAVAWHHTASSATPKSDSDYMSYGSSSKPIANLMVARDGDVWVLAAGTTNTNGIGQSMSFSRGRVPANSANSLVVGMEICNDGVGQPYGQSQIDAAFAASNAVNAHVGNLPTDVFSHHYYASTRKIDPATARAVQGPWDPSSVSTSGSWSLDDLRAECSARATSAPPQQPNPLPEGDLMFTVLHVRDHPEALGGMADKNGIIDTVRWLNPNRYNAVIAHGAPVWTVSDTELAHCDLLGPLPDSFQAGQFANHVQ